MRQYLKFFVLFKFTIRFQKLISKVCTSKLLNHPVRYEDRILCDQHFYNGIVFHWKNQNIYEKSTSALSSLAFMLTQIVWFDVLWKWREGKILNLFLSQIQPINVSLSWLEPNRSDHYQVIEHRSDANSILVNEIFTFN